MLIPKLTFAGPQRLWFTGDTHFGHGAQARRRGYDDLDKHDNDLVHKWNAVVGADDFVFHLGDFAYKCDAERLTRIFKRLNGRKHLILGNHDDEKAATLGWAAPPTHRMLVQVGSGEGQVDLVLDHYGGRTWYGSHHGAIQLYGHSHAALPATQQSCDVGVDAWGLQPVHLADIRAHLSLSPFSLRSVQDEMGGNSNSTPGNSEPL
jgi:calcineurin-like phosphoesterase family protein